MIPLLFISSEHARNDVPEEYRSLFADQNDLLNSHRGFDAGALEIALSFSRALAASIQTSRFTRLLIDLNRSPGHRNLFSEITAPLARAEKQAILDEYYSPYRERLQKRVARATEGHRTVVHLAIHTFTPVFKGKVRHVDVGLLFDPKRDREKEFCQAWESALAARVPALRVRFNAPYRGTADGVTRCFRKQFPEDRYLGIELEVNQRFLAERQDFRRLKTVLLSTLRRTLPDGGFHQHERKRKSE
jgi:predicted N-formylglutamate amidohydrolase